MNESMKPVAVNRKASFDYFLFERFEAGLCLLGHEVKSVREGRVNLKDSFVRLVGDEAFLFNCHISVYSKIQGHLDVDPVRSRKLLLNRSELNSLLGRVSQKGFTLVPLSLYFKRGLAKVEIALAKGKKQYDRRESIRRRIHDRESEAAVKRFSKKGR